MDSHMASHSIKSWPKTERPRERLIKSGPEALTEAELLAILLRNGIRGKDAVAFSREMLSSFGGLRGLLSVGPSELGRVKGLGMAKIAVILATTEIAKRQLKENLADKNVVRDPQSVLDYLVSVMRDRKREVFKILFLNKANRITRDEDLFEGTVDEAAIHTREVVRTALEYHATSLILVHNHPSGRIQPSSEDREITRKIEMACATVSVRVLDHIIIGDNGYYSFREHNLLSP
ncbi:MAG: DNA repair protein RadC [Candidatus Omnitrophica bacterium]|nr:DNA repair protein RadC [Candidatus Omnitrophota bacterium]